ncbi:MAG: peptide-methionine (R)-S-oxide reductase MsrB [Candidatus Obscuribacterales bacterium]|nr:peptide-methionine (R)-S-oxide reductase MsrB [Candidatus Obscuribacterales bacterium]
MKKEIQITMAYLLCSVLNCSVALAEATSKPDSSCDASHEQKVETKKSDDTKANSSASGKKKAEVQAPKGSHCSLTEMPFTGKYWNEHSPGTYLCNSCGGQLFDAKDKFDSGTGWPSFSKTVGEVEVKEDNSLGMHRDELLCRHCGAHLGHLFPDGPAPTGMRYCVNSYALNLKPSDAKAKK